MSWRSKQACVHTLTHLLVRCQVNNLFCLGAIQNHQAHHLAVHGRRVRLDEAPYRRALPCETAVQPALAGFLKVGGEHGSMQRGDAHGALLESPRLDWFSGGALSIFRMSKKAKALKKFLESPQRTFLESAYSIMVVAHENDAEVPEPMVRIRTLADSFMFAVPAEYWDILEAKQHTAL